MIATQSAFFMNGYNLNTALQNFQFNINGESIDCTVLANTDRTYEHGFDAGTLTATGVFNATLDTENRIHQEFSSAQVNKTNSIISASFGALSLGSLAMLLTTASQKYQVRTFIGQLITASADFQAANGIYFGVWLFNAAVDDTTTNGASHDNSASSSNGGLWHVQVQNPDEIAGDDVILQHSTDNSVWVDKATVTLTVAENEAISTTITGTINRYTRVRAAATGGEITFQSALARR